MKTRIVLMFLSLSGIIIIAGCKKEATNITVPISLTDKDGSIFIQLDTTSKGFVAYSPVKITKGHLTGVFNDTILSSFYLAILTVPYWDSIYHASDTIRFPTHYPSHSLIINAEVDLSLYASPYHFQLVGLTKSQFKSTSSGSPSVKVTIVPVYN